MPSASKGKSLLFWLSKKRHRKRRRKGDPGTGIKTLSDVLRALEPQVFQAERARCPITPTQWQEVVGLRISDRTAPRRLDADGTLLVAVSSSVWAQELSLLSAVLCERLRACGHAVQGLRFVVGMVTAPRRGPERFESRQVPVPVPIPADLQEQLRGVEDGELRELIERAAATSLAHAKADEDRAKNRKPSLAPA